MGSLRSRAGICVYVFCPILPTVGWYSKEYSHWHPAGGIKRILSAPDDKCKAPALVPNGARGCKTVKADMVNPDAGRGNPGLQAQAVFVRGIAHTRVQDFRWRTEDV